LKQVKKKKAIEKGITFEDIFQHYYVNEVRDWCREHELKTSGKKGDLIKRILAFLDGDEEATKAGQKKKKREKKLKLLQLKKLLLLLQQVKVEVEVEAKKLQIKKKRKKMTKLKKKRKRE